MNVDATKSENFPLIVILSKETDFNEEFYSFCTETFKNKAETNEDCLWDKLADKYSILPCPDNELFPTVLSFLENWDSNTLTSIEKKQERKLYDCFFMSQHNPDYKTKCISWIKKDKTIKYNLRLRGTNQYEFVQEQFAELLNWPLTPKEAEKQFALEKQLLIQRKYPLNSKVTVSSETYFSGEHHEKIEFNTDTSISRIYTDFQKLKDSTLPSPITLKRFSLTPSISQITKTIITKEKVKVIQTLT
ncbi:MAG: hypothetical protein VX777_09220 [Chlamydiota bacterium]|nr:hypothetical protein [Chlamydiota bacterium]